MRFPKSAASLFDPPALAVAARAFVWIAFLLPGCGILSYNRDGLSSYFEGLQLYQHAGMKAEKSQNKEDPEVQELLTQALDRAETSRAVYPYFPPSHKLVIDLARMLGDEEKMLHSFRYALALFPDETSLRLAYAQCLLGAGRDYPAAMRVIEDGLRRDPRNISLRQSYAELLVDSDGSAEEMERTVIDTLGMNDLPVEYFQRIGFFVNVLASKDLLPYASRILQALAARSPDGARHGFNMALSTGLGEAGLVLLEYALERQDPIPPVIRILYVRQLLFMERYDQAEAELKKESFTAAAEALGEPELIKALEAYLPLGRDDPKKAVEYFLAVLDEEPGCFFALEGLLLLHGRTPEVVDDVTLRKALRDALKRIEDPLELGMIHQALAALSDREIRKFEAR
ncbi:MAG: tetratricopeptide repeat protein [Planctomycetota bacterium]|jgi:tetratricopeptide (TPR) repeat protein